MKVNVTPDEAVRLLISVYPTWRREAEVTNGCIVGTDYGIEVLRYFGVQAKPLPVAVRIANPKLQSLLEAHVEVREEDFEKLGLHSLGTDHRLPLDFKKIGWNGHLVIWIPATRMVVDLSLDQYARPWHDMELGATGVIVEDEWWPHDTTQWVKAKTKSGCGVHYQVTPENTSYRETRDWLARRPGSNNHKLRKQRIAALIKTIQTMALAKQRMAELAEAEGGS